MRVTIHDEQDKDMEWDEIDDENVAKEGQN